jgi:hypothetical protein
MLLIRYDNKLNIMLQIPYDNKLRYRNNYAFVTISAAILLRMQHVDTYAVELQYTVQYILQLVYTTAINTMPSYT